jgi:hypothetical protein
LADTYFLIRLSGQYNTGSKIAGKLWLEEKEVGADDYVFFNGVLPTTYYTVLGITKKSILPDSVAKDASGRFGVTDILIYDTTSFCKYGKIKNGIGISTAVSADFTEGAYYSDGTDTYLQFKSDSVALLKL